MFFISTAYAQTAAAGAAGGDFMSVIKQLSPMIVIFVAMFFLMIRPQMKKQKELRNLIYNVTTGDEVITNGGLMGKVSRVKDNVLELQVAKDVEVLVQKVAVAQVLPKGTIRF